MCVQVLVTVFEQRWAALRRMSFMGCRTQVILSWVNTCQSRSLAQRYSLRIEWLCVFEDVGRFCMSVQVRGAYPFLRYAGAGAGPGRPPVHFNKN